MNENENLNNNVNSNNVNNNVNNYDPQGRMPQQSQYVYVQQQEHKESVGLAVASMVLGIISLVLFCIIYVSIPCATIGGILGAISLSTKKGGKGMAIAGLVCSLITIVIVALAYTAGATFLNEIVNELR